MTTRPLSPPLPPHPLTLRPMMMRCLSLESNTHTQQARLELNQVACSVLRSEAGPRVGGGPRCGRFHEPPIPSPPPSPAHAPGSTCTGCSEGSRWCTGGSAAALNVSSIAATWASRSSKSSSWPAEKSCTGGGGGREAVSVKQGSSPPVAHQLPCCCCCRCQVCTPNTPLERGPPVRP